METTSATLENGEVWNPGYMAWPEAVFVEEENAPEEWGHGTTCN